MQFHLSSIARTKRTAERVSSIVLMMPGVVVQGKVEVAEIRISSTQSTGYRGTPGRRQRFSCSTMRQTRYWYSVGSAVTCRQQVWPYSDTRRWV